MCDFVDCRRIFENTTSCGASICQYPNGKTIFLFLCCINRGFVTTMHQNKREKLKANAAAVTSGQCLK